MKTLKEKIEVMKAALDGKEIEHTWMNQDDWILTQTQPHPDFNWQKMDYRIKPEPMEFWVNVSSDFGFRTKEEALLTAKLFKNKKIRTIKVREVIE